MSDLISRQALCDDLREYKLYPAPISSDESEVKGYNDGIDLAISVIAEFPSAEPDNQVHLCNSCKYDYPECPAMKNDVIFGNGKGHDNVCACAKFEIKPKRKKGKWIPVESQTVNGRCSVCGYESHLYENDVFGESYCPNCGADMRGK